jgi:hypothetical protein
VAAVAEEMAAETFVGVQANSRIGTPTNFVDGVGGTRIVAPEEVGITPVPPLTQQSTKGTFWHVPKYQQSNNQLLFMSPDAMLHPPVLQRQAVQLLVQQPFLASNSQLLHSLLSHQLRRRQKGAWSLLCPTKRQRTPTLRREALLSSPMTSWPHQLLLMRPPMLYQHHLHL